MIRDIDGEWGPNGMTALMAAASIGNESMIIRLLRHGVDLEAKDDFGGTALIYAAAKHLPGPVAALLKAGANPNIRVLGNVSVLHTVCCLAGSGENATLVARLLVEAGADATAVDCDGVSPLWLAAKSGNQRVVDLLIGAGAVLNGK